MPTRIFRYEVPVDDQWHSIALQGKPLAVGCRQMDVVEFWAKNYGNEEDYITLKREFRVYGTGHPMEEPGLIHHGAAVTGGGALVWHLMERS